MQKSSDNTGGKLGDQVSSFPYRHTQDVSEQIKHFWRIRRNKQKGLGFSGNCSSSFLRGLQIKGKNSRSILYPAPEEGHITELFSSSFYS